MCQQNSSSIQMRAMRLSITITGSIYWQDRWIGLKNICRQNRGHHTKRQKKYVLVLAGRDLEGFATGSAQPAVKFLILLQIIQSMRLPKPYRTIYDVWCVDPMSPGYMASHKKVIGQE